MNIKRVSVSLVKFVENNKGKLIPIPLEIQQIQPFAADENLFLYYSKYFLNSAESLKNILFENGSGMELGNVPPYLYLHGLELYAKGKLFNIDSLGKSNDDFGRHYGHKLNKILADLKLKGITWDKDLNRDQLSLIIKLGNDYQQKSYNYADGISHENHLKINIIETSEVVNKIIENLE